MTMNNRAHVYSNQLQNNNDKRTYPNPYNFSGEEKININHPSTAHYRSKMRLSSTLLDSRLFLHNEKEEKEEEEEEEEEEKRFCCQVLLPIQSLWMIGRSIRISFRRKWEAKE